MAMNQTNQTWDLDAYFWHIYDSTAIFTAVFLSILSICTVLGNGFALYVIYKDPVKCFRTPLAIFITGILVSDFLTGLVVEPVFAFVYSQSTSYGMEDEESFTKMVRSAQVLAAVTINTSFLNALALAVAQLISMKWPDVFMRFVTRRSAIIGVVFIWIYAITFSLLPEIFSIGLAMFFKIDLILHPTAITLALVTIYIITYFAFQSSMRKYKDSIEAQTSDDPFKQTTKYEVEKEFLKGTLTLILVLVVTVWPFVIALGIWSFHPPHLLALEDFVALIICDDFMFLKFLLDQFIFAWQLPKYRKALITVFTELQKKLGFLSRSHSNATYRQTTEEQSSESDLRDNTLGHDTGTASLAFHM